MKTPALAYLAPWQNALLSKAIYCVNRKAQVFCQLAHAHDLRRHTPFALFLQPFQHLPSKTFPILVTAHIIG